MSTPVLRELGRPGDLGWVVMAHGEVFAEEFAWDDQLEVLMASFLAEFARDRDPARENAWIVEIDGQRVACALVMPSRETGWAVLRGLLVLPRARRCGIGQQLITSSVDFARSRGYERLTLWTDARLTAAQRLWSTNGFDLAERLPHWNFGRSLVGELWTLDLSTSRR